jgi:hypothetical protein
MDDKPIWSAPSPNFGDVHHARQDVPHASGHVCKFITFEMFLEPGSIDPACLDVYSSHLHPDLPKWLHTKTSRQLPLLPQRQERAMCCVPPAIPTRLASVPGDHTDHSRIDVP